jgi:hypothetical protein
VKFRAERYIGHGMRSRAQDLVTLELGPETELERITKLTREVVQERFTLLDRTLLVLVALGGNLCLARSWASALSMRSRIGTTSLSMAPMQGCTMSSLGASIQITYRAAITSCVSRLIA